MSSRAQTLFLALILALGPAVAFAGPPAAAGSPAPGASASKADSPAWKVVAAGRRVEARAQSAGESEWLRVERGDELQPRTVVRTGRRSRATLTRAGSVMIVDGDSEVELPAAGEVGSRETAVIQRRGSVLYEVEGKDHPHFEVVTPYLVAGVKGTSFLVTVDDEHASVTVEHGIVEVTQTRSGRRMDVHAGESVLQQRDELELDLVDRERRGEHPELRADGRKLESLDDDRRWFRKIVEHRGQDDDSGRAGGAAAESGEEREFRGLGEPEDDGERKFRGLGWRGDQDEERTRQEEREQQREERMSIHEELLEEQEEELKPGRPGADDDEGPDSI